MTRFLAAILFVCLMSAPAWAENYFLSPTGSNGADGLTTTTPRQTFVFAIGSGAGKAGCGDTLTLLGTSAAPGVYGDGTSTGKLSISSLSCGVGNELTIRALNSRQARIHDNGTGQAVSLTASTAGIVFDGIVVNSTNNSAATCSTCGIPFYANNTDRITFKNGLARNPNKYANVHLVYFVNSRNGLVEGNEFYDYHRHAILFYTSELMTARLNYAHPRLGKIAGGYGLFQGPVGSGDAMVSMYPCRSCIGENNFGEGNGYLFEMNATYNNQILMKDSKVLGSFWYGGSYGNGGYLAARNSSGANNSPTNNTIQHVAIVGRTGASECIKNQDPVNNLIDQVSCLSPSSTGNGIVNNDQAGLGATTMSATVTNNIVQGVDATGFVKTTVQTLTASNNFSFGNGTAFNPTVGSWGAGSGTTDPQLGTCLAWRPDGSAAATAGNGAHILYRTVNGVTGTVPLWDPTTAALPRGATVTGINDVAGSSLFDFHLRMKPAGCDFPAAFSTADPPTPPSGGAGYVTTEGTTSPSHARTITAGKEAATVFVMLKDDSGNVGTVTGVTGCAAEAYTLLGSAVSIPAYRRVVAYGKIAPGTGACTISATTSGTVSSSVLSSAEFDDISAFDDVAPCAGLGAEISCTVPTGTNETLIDGVTSKPLGSWTAGANQTLQEDSFQEFPTPTGDIRGIVSTQSGTNGGEMRHTGPNAYWAQIVVAMCPMAGCAGATTAVLTQVAGQIDSAFLVNGLIEHLGAVNAANVNVRAGVAFAPTIQTDCTVADCPSSGRKLFVRHTPVATGIPGAFVSLTDTMTNNIVFRGGTVDPMLVSGSVTTLLSGALTVVPGQTIQTSATNPISDLAQNNSTVNRWLVVSSPNAVGDIFEFKEYFDDGTAFVPAYTPTNGIKVTITPSSMQAPTGLRLAGGGSNIRVPLVWEPNIDEPFFAGYKVYRGTATGVYASTPIAVITEASAALNHTPITQWFVRELRPGTFYYIVRAFDFDGNETTASNEISAVRTGMQPRAAAQ